ncbi:MAG: IS481 family transposase [Gammaproteobacteria bacterium]|nr:MAG: IS481 family transposase [Gammaproteobacteria bacterium]RKZ93444.1 MAG: IS481 family transposase [Gammaproteobacteria bacterium]
MTNQQKEKIAVFRFGVIFPLVECRTVENWGEKERLITALTAKQWEIPFSNRTFISRGTILNWLGRYRKGGEKIEALFPSGRSDRGGTRVLDGELMDALVRMRKENPKLSVPRLVEKATAAGFFPPGKEVSLPTIYRLMRFHKVDGTKRNQDMRKFEVQMSNDLWQSDCMHGPKVVDGGKNRKTYLFALLDDHSRLIPHGQFYLAENLQNYLDCFWSALRKRGVPRKLYVDNGPSFRSHRLQIGCASLQIALTYARPYRPQGKGKIERFFRTVRSQFLGDLPEGITLGELNRRFSDYLENVYHMRKHGSTDQSPIERYIRDAKALRKAPVELPEYFRRKEVRKVNNDRSVKLDGHTFEAPAGLVGLQVTLRFENYDRIEVFVDETSKGFLNELDVHVNSRVGREKPETETTGGELFGGA